MKKQVLMLFVGLSMFCTPKTVFASVCAVVILAEGCTCDWNTEQITCEEVAVLEKVPEEEGDFFCGNGPIYFSSSDDPTDEAEQEEALSEIEQFKAEQEESQREEAEKWAAEEAARNQESQ